jgi:DNA-binding NarL/FixJ family response regulator
MHAPCISSANLANSSAGRCRRSFPLTQNQALTGELMQGAIGVVPRQDSSPEEAAINVAVVLNRGFDLDNLRHAISTSGSLRCLGFWGSEADALLGWDASPHPQVALIDIDAPQASGLDVVARIKMRWPSMQILALTAHYDVARLLSSIRLGASGYLLKSASAKEVGNAVGIVTSGGAYVTPQIAQGLVENLHGLLRKQQQVSQLTWRERQVLHLVCTGFENKQIADDLGIAPSTVHAHLKIIFKKLAVSTRTAAAMKYRDFLCSQPSA